MSLKAETASELVESMCILLYFITNTDYIIQLLQYDCTHLGERLQEGLFFSFLIVTSLWNVT